MRIITTLLCLFLVSGIVNAQFVAEFLVFATESPTTGDYAVFGAFEDEDSNGFTVNDIAVDGSHFYIDLRGNQYKIVGKSGTSPVTLQLDIFQSNNVAPSSGRGQLTSRSSNNQYYTSSGIDRQTEAFIQQINIDSIAVSADIIVDETTGLQGGNSGIPLSIDTTQIATREYVNSRTQIYGEFANDTQAGLNGVPINKRYRVSQQNSIGLPPGTIRVRKY